MKGIALTGAGMFAMAVAIPLPVASSSAGAETGKSFQVGATIQPGCLVNGQDSGNAGSLGQLDFGRDSTLSTAPHSASLAMGQSVTLRCTPGVALSMAVDSGVHGAANARYLQHGGDAGNRIPYTLCFDAACAQPIAAGQPIGVTVTAANADAVKLPIFGRLTLPGTRPAGTYRDVLTVTLSW